MIGNSGDAGTVVLGNTLQALTQLTSLDFSDNYIGTGVEGIEAIGNSLQFLTQLTFLDLSGNGIGLRGVEGPVAIGNNLQFLSKLTYLDLGYNAFEQVGDAGTIALGNSLQTLSQLTYIDLYNNEIGSWGVAGTRSIGEGLRNHRALTTLNLSLNSLGQHGSEGVEILLQNVVREGLNLNLAGAIGIPWTTGAQALATLNAGPVAAACYQQRCFGDTPPPATPASQSTGTRRLLSVDDPSLEEEESAQQVASSSFFLSRWARRGHGTFSAWREGFLRATKTFIYDDLGDWLVGKITEAAHEVVTDSPSYFPNGSNLEVRDWGSHPSFYNITSSVGGRAILPPRLQPAPLP